MTISINHKPVRFTRKEAETLHKNVLKALEFISSHPDKKIVGEDKLYNIADFEPLQEFETYLEIFLKD